MTNSEEKSKELLRSYLSSPSSDNSGSSTTTIKQESTNNKGYPWAPDPEEVLKLFEQIKKSQYINFEWHCPGRRKPNEEVNAPEPEKVLTNTARRVEVETDDFDFDEETPAPSMVRCRPAKTLKKVIKKPVSLAGILSNMERHRIMDEKLARPTTTTTTTQQQK